MSDCKIKSECIRDNLEGLKASLKYVKTIFGEVKETKVTFCFDASGSMYRVFYHFREHLIEKLFQMLFASQAQKFNIILFNSSIHQCYSKHVQCSYENIINAIRWLSRPYYESKSNLLGGLLKSFEDDPDTVYLVTDGFPSNDRQEILNHLPHISKGKPIRCIMITSTIPPDDCPWNFLKEIAQITRGSVSIMHLTNHGSVEVLMPVFYESLSLGPRLSHTDSDYECRKEMYSEKCLQGDPMNDLPLVAPFICTDSISDKQCPFYHPYFHWYWPQFWHNNGPGPFNVWSRFDKQYKCMSANFRDSRAFISGRKYLESYRDPKHCQPFAGMMLINKRVLACNYEENNKYYMGKVLSQVSPAHFLVVFDCNKEFNEAQKTEVTDIIDVDQQKRQSINVDDFVLAPVKSEAGAFDIAVVISGKENRSYTKSVIPRKDTKVTVKFLSDDSEKEMELNQSIFLSKTLKQTVERSLCRMPTQNKTTFAEIDKQRPSVHFTEFGTNNNCAVDNCLMSKGMTPCGLCARLCSCHGDTLHRCIAGKAASPVDDGNAITLEKLKELVEENSMKTKDIGSSENCKEEEEEEEDEEEEDIESESECINYCQDSDSGENERGVDEFTETDLNWCILHLLNKHAKKQQSSKEQRPIWKYWGRPGIPDVIDPPTTEPYDDPHNWGCLMPKAAVEWPSASFQEVDPHRVTNTSPQKMYDLFKNQQHQPSQRPKRDASVGRDCLPAEETRKKFLERRFNYLQGGYPKMEIKNPYSDSVKPILSSWSTVGSSRNPMNDRKCLNLLEKSRIQGQIQRDESNILRYIESKPKQRQPVIEF